MDVVSASLTSSSSYEIVHHNRVCLSMLCPRTAFWTQHDETLINIHPALGVLTINRRAAAALRTSPCLITNARLTVSAIDKHSQAPLVHDPIGSVIARPFL